MLTREQIIYINQLAHELLDIEKGRVWFDALTVDKQLEVLREISGFALQSGAMESDVNSAIRKSKLKSSYTPCVLLLKGNLKVQFSKNTEFAAIRVHQSFFSVSEYVFNRRRKTQKNEMYEWMFVLVA
jgi:hypothetical protein